MIRNGSGAFVLVALAVLSNPQIRAPFKSDPPGMCTRCPEWNAPLDPFRVFGNTYYVGTAGLSSVLITSDRGHILLDGGLPQSAEEIDRHIRRLGFRTEDVRLIVNSHTHFDHAGGIHALQHASRATVAASPSGARALKQGGPTSDDPQYGFHGEFPRVPKVRAVRDGETLRVGTLAITARSHARAHARFDDVDVGVVRRFAVPAHRVRRQPERGRRAWFHVLLRSRARRRVPREHRGRWRPPVRRHCLRAPGFHRCRRKAGSAGRRCDRRVREPAGLPRVRGIQRAAARTAAGG